MGIALASSADNISFQGRGRVYVGAVDGTSYDWLGELENFSFSLAVTTEKVKTNQYASSATILEVETEREATLSFGMREMTKKNLSDALLGAASWTDDNQSASYQNLASTTVVADKFIDLGRQDVNITKLTHGASAPSTFAVGDTITGVTSAATGKVAWKVDNTYVELVDVTAAETFVVGETIGNGTSTAVVSGVEMRKEDIVVVDAASPATRYVNGTDYSIDCDGGMLRVFSAAEGGSIVGNPYTAFDYPALTRAYNWMFQTASVQRKLVFISDKDAQGVRKRFTFHKVQVNMDGDMPLIGEGLGVLNVKGTVIAHTSQPAAQQFFKVETI